MFPVTSRYYGIETATLEVGPPPPGALEGRMVVYLRRRFIPQSTNGTIFAEHVVTQGDRLDNITASYLGDPEQFWRVCDTNNAKKPEDLTAESEIGRRLRIALPQGG